jgi:EAL domain-containing protein (putative c-di-GMP-specific phosphodiesterase class I)
VIGDEEVFLDVCVGIAVLGEESNDDPEHATEHLLTEAQNALTSAKASGGGALVFAEEQPSAKPSQLAMIARLRRAIEAEQFVMHYQPVVNLHTGRLIGVEALMRWQSNDGTMIPPGSFIPVLEETGLIEAAGAWGFNDVCRQANAWQHAGHRFDVAYNLSPRQLHQPDLLEQMVETIDQTGVDPRYLVIEITESSALADPDRAMAIMTELTRRGMRLAIDDFGVGLSSLSRLREMPASFLKIDRSFVSDLEESPRGAAMVRTIIQLAESLAMEPHAEGIETEAQRQILLESGCQLAQGFLFSRAIPAEEVLGFEARALCDALPDLNNVRSA